MTHEDSIVSFNALFQLQWYNPYERQCETEKNLQGNSDRSVLMFPNEHFFFCWSDYPYHSILSLNKAEESWKVIWFDSTRSSE